MTDGNKEPTAEQTELMNRVKSLEKEIRILKRSSDRAKPSAFGSSFGMPPLPPPSMMSATGPMMMAWLTSWLHSSTPSNPSMLDSMARFAASREEFWHHSFEALAGMAYQAANANQSNGEGDSVVSPDDKKKIKAALENQKLDPHVVDSVLHAMNALDTFQHYREMAMRGRHSDRV